MAEYRITGPAQTEIARILDWSESRFGDLAMQRYAALLGAAITDIAKNPHHLLVDWKRLAAVEIGLYHIGHSRAHVPVPPGPVNNPRHYLVFRMAEDGVVDILGFIHDHMLLEKAMRRILKENQGEAP